MVEVTNEDDELPVAQSADISGAFDEFMEMDGNALGVDPDALRIAFAAGAAAALMVLGGQLHEASRDTGGTIQQETAAMLTGDCFKEVSALLAGDDDGVVPEIAA